MTRPDWLCAPFAVNRGTSGGHEDAGLGTFLIADTKWRSQRSQSGDSEDGC